MEGITVGGVLEKINAKGKMQKSHFGSRRL
jgi:hypothetical protein